MKLFATTALTLATMTPFVAAQVYTAKWTYSGDCDTAPLLGEFKPETTETECSVEACAATTADSGFSAETTCPTDYKAAASTKLNAASYVLVEDFNDDACTDPPTEAIAVTASGQCIPSTDDNKAYKVTTADGKATWVEYTDPTCTDGETTTEVTVEELSTSTCANKKKWLLVTSTTGEETSGPSATTPAPSATTPAPSATTPAPSATTPAPSATTEPNNTNTTDETPTPSPSAGMMVTAICSTVAIAVAAVATAVF